MTTWPLTIRHALDTIRTHPELFLYKGIVSGHSLATRLFDDVLFMGDGGIVLKIGAWWVIAAEYDWIEQGRGSRPLGELFDHPCPFPEAGINSVRSEAIVRAFSKHLVIGTRTEQIPIVGEAVSGEFAERLSHAFPHWVRYVAFQLDEQYVQG